MESGGFHLIVDGDRVASRDADNLIAITCVCNINISCFATLKLDATECQNGFHIMKFLPILECVFSISEIVLHQSFFSAFCITSII